MKKLILLITVLISANLFAQSDGLSYQAVILDPNPQEIPGQDITSNVLQNAPVTVRFTIQRPGGTVIYREIQTTQTDRFGMINLIIGQGQPVNGVFTEIDWNGLAMDLNVDINLDGNFKFLNKERLTFIPYAFHRNIKATGTLRVDGETLFGNNLTVEGTTNLNGSLSVNNESSSIFTGRLDVDGVTTLNNVLQVANGSPTQLTGTLDVDGATSLDNTLTVEEATQLNSTLNVDGATTLNNTLDVLNESPTTLTGDLTVNGVTDLNNEVNVNNGSPLNLSGDLNVDGNTTFNNDLTVNGETNLNDLLNVNNNSPSNLSGTLNVEGLTTLQNNLQVFGISNLENDLNVNNQSPTSLSGSLTVDLETNLNSSLSVNNGAPTFLSGTLNVLGPITLNNNLTVNGITNLNNSLFVNNGSNTNLSGDLNVVGATDLDNDLIVDGVTTLNDELTVANASPVTLTGTLNVDQQTDLNAGLNVNNDSQTNLSGTLDVQGVSTFNNNVEVANQSSTLLTGTLQVDGVTSLNDALNVNNASPVNLSGTLEVDGITNLNNELNVNNQSATTLSGTLEVDLGSTFNDEVTILGATFIDDKLQVSGTATLGGLSAETIAIESNNPNYVATFTNTNADQGDGILIKLGKNAGAWDGSQFLKINNPLVGDGLSPPANALYQDAMDFIKGKFQNPGPITTQDVINIAPSAIRNGAITAVNHFVFTNINTNLGITNGKDLPAVVFPQTNILQALPIFDGITIPFVDITIPGFGLPNIDILPNPGGVPPGLLNPLIPDFIPALPGLSQTGGLGNVEIPTIPSGDVPNSLSKANKYVSFQDVAGRETGSIRAQSVSDFYAATVCDPVYLINLASQFIGVDLADGLTAGAVEITNLIDAYNKIGVEYTSGNGDYAEWLERLDYDEYITSGDIVAVKGGKITRDLSEVEQIMVVSHHPIILGNTPEEGTEQLGNNVAFMGQVPVKVLGPVRTGDFIVADTSVPGYGTAVSLNDMTPEQFVLAVGRSWEENLNPGPKMVNTVVGVHNGDWANIVKKLEEKQRSYERQFKAIEAQVNVLEAKADNLIVNQDKK